MDFSQPFRALTPTLDGPVLRVLARTTQPMTRQQVTNLVGEASEAGVRKVLQRLAGQGVVIEQRIGTHYTYVANREHILWAAVEVVASAAARLDTKIRDHVEAWQVPALSVELFGSVAAGTSTGESDVDLMVYRPHLADDQIGPWDCQVAELRMAVERWTGNPCEVLEIDPPTLVAMAAADEPVLRARRVPISGLNMAAASPSIGFARSIQKAMASNDASRAMLRSSLTNLADSVITPEFLRTIDELRKTFASDAMLKQHSALARSALATSASSLALEASRKPGR